MTVGIAAIAIFLPLPVVLFALYYRTVPNIFEMPVFQLWQLLGSLFSSNTEAAFRLLFSQPVAVIGYLEAGTGLRVWEVYAYPVPTLVLLAGVFYGSVVALRFRRQRPRQVRVAAGISLMAIGLYYVRVSACCTGPGWAVDVWLRGLALVPAPGGVVDWAAFYQRVESTLLSVQVILVLTGMALIAHAVWGRTKRD
jgi:hypothetical protein